MRKPSTLFLALCLAAVSAHAQQQCAATLTPEQLDRRIDDLIGQMTPAERIAQLQDQAPAISRLRIPAYNWWNEGLHGIARNGYATVFPQAIGLAATFDLELMERVGDVVSTEARAKFNLHRASDSARYAGLTIWSPNINIFRDPRWGRGQETYGEDPYLTGALGSAFVQGIQGSDPFYRKAIATPKHFAVHSGPESIRDGFNSVASQHDLADTYLAAFRQLTTDAGAQHGAQAESLMCSYNAINGTPACANPELLQGRLRNKWGFHGYVVSDCDAVDEVTDYLHFTPDHAHGAAASLKAGVDLDCGRTYNHLNESLQQGLIAQSDVDRALHRLLLARMRLGMLQPAGCSPYDSIATTTVDTAQQRELALRAAEESAVLLRNDATAASKRLLPLDLRGKRMAVIGPTADLLSVIEANYHGTARHPLTLVEGLRQALPKDAQIVYAQGSTLASGVTVPVPSTAFRSGALHGEYFPSTDLSGKPALIRRDSRIDFDFDHVSPLSDASSSDEQYSIRWSGRIIPPAAGVYRLRVAIDRCFDCKGHDGYRLWLDGQQVLADDGSKGNTPSSVALDWKDTQQHALRLELLHTGEDQGIHLEWEAPAEAQLAESLAVASKADAILALVGLSPDLEGEALQIKVPGFDGGDRTDLRLPEVQRNLLIALGKLHKPMIVGITSGSPVATGSVTNEITEPLALLQLWYPGEEGGHALANLLTGRTSPSGRLPVTVYRSADDLPAFTDYAMTHRTYRYFDGPVEFPFGFGLSYASFRYSAPELSTKTLAAGQPLPVQTSVTNTSRSEADEVVELYLIPPQTAGAPRRALQGIQRVHLKAGESRAVQFNLSPRQLSFVDANGVRAIRAGSYRVVAGGAQPEDLTHAGASFEITGEMQLEP